MRAARKQLNEEAYFDVRSAAAARPSVRVYSDRGCGAPRRCLLGKLVLLTGLPPPPILGSIQQTLERLSNGLRDGCCLRLHSYQPGAGILHFECTRATLLCSPHLSPASSRRHFRQVMGHIWVIFTPLSSHYLEKLTFFTFFVLGEEVVIELSEYKFFGRNLNWNCQKCLDSGSLDRDWGGGTF